MTVDIEKRAREIVTDQFVYKSVGKEVWDAELDTDDAIAKIAAALRQAREEALEESARICDRYAAQPGKHIGPLHAVGVTNAAKWIASDIRALKVGQSHSTDGQG